MTPSVTWPAGAPLQTYVDIPLDDGDAVLLLDGTVCLEIGRLTEDWSPEHRAGLVEMLVATCTTVLLALARPGRAARPADLIVWAELRDALAERDLLLLPLALLPTA